MSALAEHTRGRPGAGGSQKHARPQRTHFYLSCFFDVVLLSSVPLCLSSKAKEIRTNYLSIFAFIFPPRFFFAQQRCGAASRWRDKCGRGDVSVGVRRACGCVVARLILWALCCVCPACLHRSPSLKNLGEEPGGGARSEMRPPPQRHESAPSRASSATRHLHMSQRTQVFPACDSRQNQIAACGGP